MGDWSAESEALGLVRLMGRGVPGEVGRARVTRRCVTGLGESQRHGGQTPGRVSIPGGSEGGFEESKAGWRMGEATSGSEGYVKTTLP